MDKLNKLIGILAILGILGALAQTWILDGTTKSLKKAEYRLDTVSRYYERDLAGEYVRTDCGLATKEFADYTAQDKTCVTGAEAKAHNQVAGLKKY